MFKMPEGKEIDVEVVVQKGAIQPFDVGVISLSLIHISEPTRPY